ARSSSMNCSSFGTIPGSGEKKGFSPTASQDLNAILFGPICARWPRTSTPYRSRSHFFAIAPAATRIAVSRAEARPPPRRSQAVFLQVGVIGVAGTEGVGERAVVLAFLVFVPDEKADRSARGPAFENAREDLDP